MSLNPELKKFRLGVYANAPGDARSLSRLLGPLQLMAREEPRLELVHPKRTPDNAGWDLDWQFMTACDAVIFLDPYTQEDVRRVGLARACGTAVWADYIDDLLNVRPSNPVWLNYANKDATRKHIANVCRGASVVTVTTETLRQQLPNPDSVVVLPESCRWPMSDLPRTQTITWRGFGSHNEDLESVLPQLKEIAHLPQYTNWDWCFIGEPYWKIFDGIIPKDRLVYVPPLTPYDLMNRWGGMAPYLHIVPLADHAFNRSKTPLAWLEATALGAVTLAAGLPEWRECPGLLTYDPDLPETFGTVLRRTLDNYKAGQMHPGAAISRNAIYPMRTTAAVNEIRWEIINRIAEIQSPATERPTFNIQHSTLNGETSQTAEGVAA